MVSRNFSFVFSMLLLLFACGEQESNFRGGEARVQDPSQADQEGVKQEANSDLEVQVKSTPSDTSSPPSDEIKDELIGETSEAPREEPLETVEPSEKPAEQVVEPEPEYSLVSGEFVSSTLETVQTDLDVSGEYESQSFTVAYEKTVTENSKTFQQITRGQVTNTHTQGYSGKQESEVFSVSSTGILDLLIVVDNSGSMKQEQTNLSDKLSPLLEYVKESDWQIGVVTTDPNDACLRGLIKRDDQNRDAAFAAAVMAGTDGSGNERGILQAVTGLKCVGNPWVRDQSTLGVLIVSDEDNCSDGGDCRKSSHQNASYLTDYLSSIRELGKSARVYGLYHVPGTSCGDAYNEAKIYHEAVTASSGKEGSICDADYSNTLRAISSDIGQILETTFELSTVPESGSLEVYVDGNLLTSGYTLTGKTLEISSFPEGSKELNVKYRHGATPTYSDFSLSQEPLPGSVEVYV